MEVKEMPRGVSEVSHMCTHTHTHEEEAETGVWPPPRNDLITRSWKVTVGKSWRRRRNNREDAGNLGTSKVGKSNALGL